MTAGVLHAVSRSTARVLRRGLVFASTKFALLSGATCKAVNPNFTSLLCPAGYAAGFSDDATATQCHMMLEPDDGPGRQPVHARQLCPELEVPLSIRTSIGVCHARSRLLGQPGNISGAGT